MDMPNKWSVYYNSDRKRWIANRDWRSMPFPDWHSAFRYAYLHATAERNEVP